MAVSRFKRIWLAGGTPIAVFDNPKGTPAKAVVRAVRRRAKAIAAVRAARDGLAADVGAANGQSQDPSEDVNAVLSEQLLTGVEENAPAESDAPAPA